MLPTPSEATASKTDAAAPHAPMRHHKVGRIRSELRCRQRRSKCNLNCDVSRIPARPSAPWRIRALLDEPRSLPSCDVALLRAAGLVRQRHPKHPLADGGRDVHAARIGHRFQAKELGDLNPRARHRAECDEVGPSRACGILPFGRMLAQGHRERIVRVDEFGLRQIGQPYQRTSMHT